VNVDIGLLPHQMDFVSSEEPVVLLCGGRGAGKTFCGATWAMRMMLGWPGSVGLIGAQNPAQLDAVVLKALVQSLESVGCPWACGEPPPWFRSRYKRHAGVVSIPNGSQALCRSMHESGSDRNIRGLEVQWCWLDEVREMTEYTFDVVSACLRGFGAGPYLLRMTTTPNGRDWCYRRCMEGGARVIPARTADNWHLPADYEDRLRSQYSEEMAAQELDAAIVVMGKGRMYRFSQERHVRPCQPSPRLPLVFSLDLNVSPMCGVVMQVDKASRSAWVLDELMIEDGALTKDMVALLRREWPEWRAGLWFMGDEASDSQSTRTPESDIDIMRSLLRGYPGGSRCLNDGRKPRVVDRVNVVNGLLEPALGEPRLHVDPSCRKSIEDLEGMRWQEGVRKADKRDKQRSHFTEAMGYALEKLLPISAGPLLSGRDF